MNELLNGIEYIEHTLIIISKKSVEDQINKLNKVII